MPARDIISHVVRFIFYLALQLLLLRNVVLFDYAFCFVYIGALILLPFEMGLTALLLIGFGLGVVVDTFYNTLGMHAAATVAIAYARPFIVRIQMAQRIQEDRVDFTLRELSIGGFTRYVFVMVLLHHLLLFLIEAGSLSLLGPTLLRAVASAVFTTVTLLLLQVFNR